MNLLKISVLFLVICSLGAALRAKEAGRNLGDTMTQEGQFQVATVDYIDLICSHPLIHFLDPDTKRFKVGESRFRDVKEIESEMGELNQKREKVYQERENLNQLLKKSLLNSASSPKGGSPEELQQKFLQQKMALTSRLLDLENQHLQLEILKGFNGLTGNSTLIPSLKKVIDDVEKAIAMTSKVMKIETVLDSSIIQGPRSLAGKVREGIMGLSIYQQPYYKFLKGGKKLSPEELNLLTRWGKMKEYPGSFPGEKVLIYGGKDLTSSVKKVLFKIWADENKITLQNGVGID